MDPSCYFCLLNVKHPWHDDGSEGPNIEDYYQDAANGMPRFHTEENGFQ